MKSKKLKNLDPHSPEVISGVLKMIDEMTPEELWAFVIYKTPGIEETDMTGLFPIATKDSEDAPSEAARIAPRKRVRSVKTLEPR